MILTKEACMQTRRVGKSNIEASIIGFGCWGISGDFTKVNENDIISVLRKAQQMGVNFFDVAPVYGASMSGAKGFGRAEILLGKALKKVRNKVILATKFGIALNENEKGILDSSENNIKKEIDSSLIRLQTDYIDLYQVHWHDQDTSIMETFTTLNDLKKMGKIRAIGVCNYSVSLIKEAMKYSEIASSQNLYNIIQRNSDAFYHNNLIYRTENEILPFCEKNNIGFFPYSPFCQGLLTGKLLKLEDYEFNNDFRKSNSELSGEKLINNLNLVKELLKLANAINKPLSQVVLNWLIKDKRITSIIAGPTKMSELEDNVNSTFWELDNETYKNINVLIKKQNNPNI
jgi:aryl-alcohol dehydrogenase-like predicted oxidoreductase